jgi:hypothetical protein
MRIVLTIRLIVIWLAALAAILTPLWVRVLACGTGGSGWAR